MDTWIVSALRLYCSGTVGNLQYELFRVGSGITVPLPYPGCEPSDPSGLPSCDSDLMQYAVHFIGAAPGATLPTSTNCPSTMKKYEKCNAECGANQAFAGYIQCYNGTLMGESLCANPATHSTKDVSYLRSSFAMLAAGSPLTADLAKQGLASALAVATTQFTVFWQRAVVPHTGRRLHTDDTYNYTVKYDVRIPDGTSATNLANKMKKVGEANSQERYLMHAVLTGGGVTLQEPPGIFAVSDARLVQQPTFVDKANGQEVEVVTTAERAPQIIPAQDPAPSPSPSPKDDDDDTNNTTLVLGMVGGLFAVSIIVGCCYFGASRQRAPTPEGSNPSRV